MRYRLLPLAALAASLQHVLADCECGFTINATDVATHAVFTDLLETDFLHLHDVTFNSTHDTGWIPQVYNLSSDAALARPYGKAAQLRNVVPNPISSIWDWGGNGQQGGDAGLQLFVRSKPIRAIVEGQYDSLLIPMAELVSARSDVLYGSFRVGMKVTGETGTCGAFFWYHNDTAEIDIEFLSRQQNSSSSPVNLAIQSPASYTAGINGDSNPDFDLHQLAFSPVAGYHEYRFDWLPDSVRFYADSELLTTFTTNIPSAPGRIMLNHWSNGNPGWSAGPPMQDAVVTVSYVKAYFNSTNTTRMEQYGAVCSQTDALGKTCVIPDQLTPPEPSGANGNATGKTYFFELEKNLTGTGQVIYRDGMPGLNGGNGTGSSGTASSASSALHACSISVVSLIAFLLLLR